MNNIVFKATKNNLLCIIKRKIADFQMQVKKQEFDKIIFLIKKKKPSDNPAI